jgi:hypothetical protein
MTGKIPIAISIMDRGTNNIKFIAKGILISKPMVNHRKNIIKAVIMSEPNT